MNHLAGIQLLPKTPKGKYIEVKNEYIKIVLLNLKKIKIDLLKALTILNMI